MEHSEINRAIEMIHRVAGEAYAYLIVSSRADEAHKYCQEYLMPQAWSKNIWHAILDDAIRMRKLIDESQRPDTR